MNCGCDIPLTIVIDRLVQVLRIVLSALVLLGFVAVVADEIVRVYRGWKNTSGTLVNGYALYEQEYHSSLNERRLSSVEALPRIRWELISVHQWKIECEFIEFRKNANWHDERLKLLEQKVPVGGPKLSGAEDPAEIVLRYHEWSQKRKAQGLSDEVATMPMFTEKDLPVQRYKCVATPSYYQLGMGWGLF
jgi:hypothetical protein